MQWWQILLLTLYSGYQILDELTIASSAGSPVFAGFISGLIMGDVGAGLYIGGSLQLYVLGVGTFGGASRIDATSGAVLATAFSVSTGMKLEVAITSIAVPVAMLMIQTDILGRLTTTYFAHRIDAHIENFDYKGIERNYLFGALPWALSRALPVFLALKFGHEFVTNITTYMSKELPWLEQGLAVAGGALPGVGFAILLRYLPVKKHFAYLVAGFTITALLTTLFSYTSALSDGVGRLFGAFDGLLSKEAAEKLGALGATFNGLPFLSIALIGFAIAALHFRKLVVAPKVMVANSSTEGEIDDDEI